MRWTPKSRRQSYQQFIAKRSYFITNCKQSYNGLTTHLGWVQDRKDGRIEYVIFPHYSFIKAGETYTFRDKNKSVTQGVVDTWEQAKQIVEHAHENLLSVRST